jgi:protein-S-isoprenylcysteine O-methyltransferase Ste14
LVITAAALSLSLAFFLLAFVLRSLVQRRRTGDYGFRLGSAGAVPRVASAFMVVGFLVVFGAIVRAMMEASDSSRALDRLGWRSVGLAVMALSLIGTWIAQLDLRDSWRIGVDQSERTALVSDGLFRFVRNPIFTGMLAFAIGMVLVAINWFAIAGAVLLIAGLELQVRAVEEPYLLRMHGPEYEIYAARVGRFLPGIGTGVRRK